MTIRRVFGVPRSRAAGWFLAGFNGPMNRRLADRLPLEGSERLLEIGPGPGVAMEWFADRLPRGQVVGVDLSAAMRLMAEARLARRIPPERFRLVAGDVTDLPFPDASFDAIYSANSAQLWEPWDTAVREITRIAAPGSRLLLGVQEVAIRGAGQGVEEFSRRLANSFLPPHWEAAEVARASARVRLPWVANFHYRYLAARRAGIEARKSAAGRA